MRLYLAGPMSGVPGGNFDAFRAAAADLREQGYRVESPVEMNEEDGEAAVCEPGHPRRQEFLARDVAVILRTDVEGVVVLDGWRSSAGARLEVGVAQGLGKIVLTYPELWPVPAEPDGAESVLAEAERLVSGSRASSYGHPAEHSGTVADLWRAAFGWEVDAFRVNVAMWLFKTARAIADPTHRDSLADVAGYTRTAEAVQARAGVPGFMDLPLPRP